MTDVEQSHEMVRRRKYMYYFIVNEYSGSGNARLLWHKIQVMLRDGEIAYKAWKTEYAGHATKLAQHISKCEEEKIHLVVVGGDGTISEVLNGITSFDKVYLGVIPTGSGNDFIHGVGIPRDTREAFDLLISSKGDMTVDLGRVTFSDQTSKIFGISSGIGMDAYICKKVHDSKLKKILNFFNRGDTVYLMKTIQTLLTLRMINVSVRFDEEEETFLKKGVFLAAMNVRTEGGGIPMTPMASVHDGNISICIGYEVRRWKLFYILAKLVKGKHVGRREFLIRDCQKIAVHYEEPVEVHIDGEPMGEHTDIQMECIANQLHMLI